MENSLASTETQISKTKSKKSTANGTEKETALKKTVGIQSADPLLRRPPFKSGPPQENKLLYLSSLPENYKIPKKKSIAPSQLSSFSAYNKKNSTSNNSNKTAVNKSKRTSISKRSTQSMKNPQVEQLPTNSVFEASKLLKQNNKPRDYRLDFDSRWEYFLELKTLDEARNRIYCSTFFQIWKKLFLKRYLERSEVQFSQIEDSLSSFNAKYSPSNSYSRSRQNSYKAQSMLIPLLSRINDKSYHHHGELPNGYSFSSISTSEGRVDEMQRKYRRTYQDYKNDSNLQNFLFVSPNGTFLTEDSILNQKDSPNTRAVVSESVINTPIRKIKKIKHHSHNIDNSAEIQRNASPASKRNSKSNIPPDSISQQQNDQQDSSELAKIEKRFAGSNEHELIQNITSQLRAIQKFNQSVKANMNAVETTSISDINTFEEEEDYDEIEDLNNSANLIKGASTTLDENENTEVHETIPETKHLTPNGIPIIKNGEQQNKKDENNSVKDKTNSSSLNSTASSNKSGSVTQKIKPVANSSDMDLNKFDTFLGDNKNTPYPIPNEKPQKASSPQISENDYQDEYDNDEEYSSDEDFDFNTYNEKSSDVKVLFGDSLKDIQNQSKYRNVTLQKLIDHGNEDDDEIPVDTDLGFHQESSNPKISSDHFKEILERKDDNINSSDDLYDSDLISKKELKDLASMKQYQSGANKYKGSQSDTTSFNKNHSSSFSRPKNDSLYNPLIEENDDSDSFESSKVSKREETSRDPVSNSLNFADSSRSLQFLSEEKYSQQHSSNAGAASKRTSSESAKQSPKMNSFLAENAMTISQQNEMSSSNNLNAQNDAKRKNHNQPIKQSSNNYLNVEMRKSNMSSPNSQSPNQKSILFSSRKDDEQFYSHEPRRESIFQNEYKNNSKLLINQGYPKSENNTMFSNSSLRSTSPNSKRSQKLSSKVLNKLYNRDSSSYYESLACSFPTDLGETENEYTEDVFTPDSERRKSYLKHSKMTPLIDYISSGSKL